MFHAQQPLANTSFAAPIQVCQPVVNLRLTRKLSDAKDSRSEFQTVIFLSQEGANPSGIYQDFVMDTSIRYDAFCDDFGPMNMRCVFQFIEDLDKHITKCISNNIGQLVQRCSAGGARAFTNAAFLLGSYLILRFDNTPEDVEKRFSALSFQYFEGYRDATYEFPAFRLDLIDCWRGLHRGKQIGWVTMPSSLSNPDWGKIDRDMYVHYDNPLNADLHEVLPGKFIAFRGPNDLCGPLYANNYESHTRKFDPKYYLDIFDDLGVTTVVRLNETQYDSKVFRDHNIKHHDLYFDDCTSPPPHIVAKFFAIADATDGLVAVHCKAGLGRTGTLIALYMMCRCGFSARAAMGWLRIMRPGSVIGEQQHFLCRIESGSSNLKATCLSSCIPELTSRDNTGLFLPCPATAHNIRQRSNFAKGDATAATTPPPQQAVSPRPFPTYPPVQDLNPLQPATHASVLSGRTPAAARPAAPAVNPFWMAEREQSITAPPAEKTPASQLAARLRMEHNIATVRTAHLHSAAAGAAIIPAGTADPLKNEAGDPHNGTSHMRVPTHTYSNSRDVEQEAQPSSASEIEAATGGEETGASAQATARRAAEQISAGLSRRDMARAKAEWALGPCNRSLREVGRAAGQESASRITPSALSAGAECRGVKSEIASPTAEGARDGGAHASPPLLLRRACSEGARQSELDKRI